MKNGGNAVSLTAKTDYYPGGMPMPNRNIEGNYRYKFQGQEKDAETGKEAFELRLWDEVHDRGVFCASLGGFELGLGLQDRGKGDDKEQNYIGWSPNEVEDRFSNYDISNNKDRKNHARWEVYPSLFQR